MKYLSTHKKIGGKRNLDKSESEDVTLPHK